MLSLNKIKNITLGIIIGLSIASTHTFAQDIKEYILSKVKYPIIVNGVEYVNDELPILNYNNSTYVPLRAVGNLLNTKVNWNENLKRVEIDSNNDIVNESTNVKETTTIKDINGEIYITHDPSINDIASDEIFKYADLDKIEKIYINDKLYYRYSVLSNLLDKKGYLFIYPNSGDGYIQKKVDDIYYSGEFDIIYTLKPNEIKLINHRLFVDQNILNEVP